MFSSQTRYFQTTSLLFAGAAQSKSVGGIVQFNLADIGEGIAECEILKWYVGVGDKIQEFQLLCEVQSDKATVEIKSRYSGVVKKLHYEKGTMAKVGTPLVDIDTGLPSVETAATSASTKSETKITQKSNESPTQQEIPKQDSISADKVLTTPAVRFLARKENINLTTVEGTGKQGRILKEDVLNYLSSRDKEAKPKDESVPQPPSVSIPITATAQDQVIPLSGYSRVMVKTMTAANQVPHFGYNDEIIVDRMIQLRKELKQIAEQRQLKLTYMPIILKAISMALKKYPVLNASFDVAKSVMIYKGSHNLGVAMDTPQGLIVPNIKNCQEKSIFEIAKDLERIHKSALKGGVAKEDLTGGTFTLSNIGSIGGTYASPVILLPEVAIGALGKIQKLPRFDEKGNIIPVHVMNVSWSADHRVIDGATMANFSNLWKMYIENPQTMVFDAK